MDRLNKEKLLELISALRDGSEEVLSTIRESDIIKSKNASAVLSALKLDRLMRKEEEETMKKKNLIITVVAVIAAIAAIAGIAYALYRYFTPDYLEDFEEEDFDDEDFFEDEDEDQAEDQAEEQAEDQEEKQD